MSKAWRLSILWGVGGFWFAVGLFVFIAAFVPWKPAFDVSLFGLGLTLIGLSLMFWDKAKKAETGA